MRRLSLVADVPPTPSSDVVLLADDNDDDILLFKRAYETAGIETPLRIVHDGEETINYLKGSEKFRDRAK